MWTWPNAVAWRLAWLLSAGGPSGNETLYDVIIVSASRVWRISLPTCKHADFSFNMLKSNGLYVNEYIKKKVAS